MDIELNILQNWIQESDNIVFISGADLSAEAGFPDYRIMTQADWARYKYCLLYTSVRDLRCRALVNDPSVFHQQDHIRNVRQVRDNMGGHQDLSLIHI